VGDGCRGLGDIYRANLFTAVQRSMNNEQNDKIMHHRLPLNFVLTQQQLKLKQ